MSYTNKENFITTLKIVIIGESGVGKSRFIFILFFLLKILFLLSLMYRFVDDVFSNDISVTIGFLKFFF